jgi:hypothetical protein
MLYGVSAAGLNYHLFVNTYTAQNISILSNFVECTLTGYAPQNVIPADFTIQSVSGHIATIIAAPIVFTATAGTVYVQGWYATDSTNAVLMACSTFDSPQLLQLGSPAYVVPAFGDYSQLAF